MNNLSAYNLVLQTQKCKVNIDNDINMIPTILVELKMTAGRVRED